MHSGIPVRELLDFFSEILGFVRILNGEVITKSWCYKFSPDMWENGEPVRWTFTGLNEWNVCKLGCLYDTVELVFPKDIHYFFPYTNLQKNVSRVT